MKYNPIIENYLQMWFKDGKVDLEKIAGNITQIPLNVLAKLNFYIALQQQEDIDKMAAKGNKEKDLVPGKPDEGVSNVLTAEQAVQKASPKPKAASDKTPKKPGRKSKRNLSPVEHR